MDRITCYFDFISPYAYLQLEGSSPFPVGPAIAYKPILFAGLLNHWGHLGPAEIPRKRIFTYQYVAWYAKRHGIELRFPSAHPFNPLKALRLALVCGSRESAIRTIFRFIWRDGGDLQDGAAFADLCRKLAIEDGETRVADPAIKAQLIANTEEAKALGLFGVPTLIIDGHLFWGNDATQMAADFLADPLPFQSGEMKRLADLPSGATRT